jgi:hypothetical protein
MSDLYWSIDGQLGKRGEKIDDRAPWAGSKFLSEPLGNVERNNLLRG